MTLLLVQQTTSAWDLNQHIVPITLQHPETYLAGDLMTMVVMGSIHRSSSGAGVVIGTPPGWIPHGTYEFVGRPSLTFPPGGIGSVPVSVISPVFSKAWTGETSLVLTLPDDWWFPERSTCYCRIEVWRGAVGDVQGVIQTTNSPAADPGITGSGRIFIGAVNTRFQTTGPLTLAATGFTGGFANVATDPGAPSMGWAFATKHLDAAGPVTMPGVDRSSAAVATPNTLSWFIRDTPDVAAQGFRLGKQRLGAPLVGLH
jgi:hypothetical protein